MRRFIVRIGADLVEQVTADHVNTANGLLSFLVHDEEHEYRIVAMYKEWVSVIEYEYIVKIKEVY